MFNEKSKQKNEQGTTLDFLKGLARLDSGSSETTESRDEAGNFQRSVVENPGYSAGRKVNDIAQYIPGGIGAVAGATETYERNKDRVPNIIGGLASKYGGGDPRLEALTRLQDNSRNLDEDLEGVGMDVATTLGGRGAMKALGGAAKMAKKHIPGLLGGGTMLGMTTASIRAGEADKLANKMQSGKLGQKQKEDIANISKRNYLRLSDAERNRLKASEKFIDDASVQEYLDNATRGTRKFRGASVDPRLPRLLGATYPDTLLERTGGTARGTLGETGFAGFDPNNNEGSMFELLRRAYHPIQ